MTSAKPTRKQKGEVAEMAFAAKAMGMGMTVSRPYAETAYDFVVECRGRLSRVQVKSGWKEWHGGYPVKMSNYERPYRVDEIDYVVVYVPPEEAWYVVPVGAVTRRRTTSFYPQVLRSRGALEVYREAWELLGKEKGQREKGKAGARSLDSRFPRCGSALARDDNPGRGSVSLRMTTPGPSARAPSRRRAQSRPGLKAGPGRSRSASSRSLGMTSEESARDGLKRRRARAGWQALGEYLFTEEG